tara:strand:- start:92 stop:589 length:498 start_codon:yes stop_codon:yes gene_type:complete
MANDNPEALVALEDSLSTSGLSPSMSRLLTFAHNRLGTKELEIGNYEKAIVHFSHALQLSDGDTLSQYNLLLAEGHSIYKKGNKNGLWDAIQKYNKAAQLKPRLGEAYYYIGLSYHKIGDTDFDLIVEAYEKALALSLKLETRQKTEDALSLVLEREKRLKDFWK